MRGCQEEGPIFPIRDRPATMSEVSGEDRLVLLVPTGPGQHDRRRPQRPMAVGIPACYALRSGEGVRRGRTPPTAGRDAASRPPHPEPSRPVAPWVRMSDPSRSPLRVALSAFAAAPSEANRVACFDALRDGAVYLCVGPPGADTTGYEPQFSLVEVSGRRLMIAALPDLPPALFVFAERADAEAWATRVPGYLAEPVPAPAAADLAVRAGAEPMVDPLSAALRIDRATIAWGRCPRRPLATTSFGDAFAAWHSRPGPATLEAMQSATRDTVFYLIEHPSPIDGAPAAQVSGRWLALEAIDGAYYLTASTDRRVVEGWCADTVSRVIALDGPALLELGAQLGVDVGFCIGAQRAIAVAPHEPWPRRPLTVSDF